MDSLERPDDWNRTYSFEEVERRLKEEFGWQLEPTSYTDAPIPLSIYIPDNLINHIAYLRHILLRGYYIHDKFGKDHMKRRQFIEREIGIYPFLRDYSKLKRMTLVIITGTIGTVIRHLRDRYPSKHSELCGIFDHQYHQKQLATYNNMEVDERIAYVKSLDEVIYKFLEALSY